MAAAPITGTATISPPSSIPPFVTYTQYDTDGNQIYHHGHLCPGSNLDDQFAHHLRPLQRPVGDPRGHTDSCTTSAPSTELPCATIDADGVVTQLAYDSQGDLTSKSTPDGNDASSAGTISTFAGAPMGAVPGTSWLSSRVRSRPRSGGVSYAYVADNEDNVIRRINLSTGAETIVAGDYSTATAATAARPPTPSWPAPPAWPSTPRGTSSSPTAATTSSATCRPPRAPTSASP